MASETNFSTLQMTMTTETRGLAVVGIVERFVCPLAGYDADEFAHSFFDIEGLLHGFASLTGQLRPFVGIRCKVQDGVSDRFRRTRRDDQADNLIFYGFGAATNVCDDARQATRHGFQNGNRKAFQMRSKNEGRARVQVGPDVFLKTFEGDEGRQTFRIRQFHQLFPEGSITDDDALATDALANNPREGIDENVDAFRLDEAGRAYEQELVGFDIEACSHCRSIGFAGREF